MPVASEKTRLSLVDERGAPPAAPDEVTDAPAVIPAGEEPTARTAAAETSSAVIARPRSAWRRRLLLGVVIAGLLAGGGWYGERWWTVGRFTVSTDDAYVRADTTTLAAKVSGYITAIAVPDNARVHAGDVIARIDDGDYRLALEAAKDKVATQQATVARFAQQITAQQATVAQARAQLASAEAGARQAESDLSRQQQLAAKNFASRKALEQAQAARDQAVAAVTSARAGVTAAEAAIDVLEAQRTEAERGLAELATARDKAARDLSFAVIRAPVDGVIGNRAMQVGDFVQPGQRLAAIVPLDAVYIDANFKETQLAALRPGQPVSISVDAFGDRPIEGTVASVAPASGSVFSLLPPDNATGNFTKIVQRVPVRVRVPAAVAEERLLRPGMSVVVSVDTRTQAGHAAARLAPAPSAARTAAASLPTVRSASVAVKQAD